MQIFRQTYYHNDCPEQIGLLNPCHYDSGIFSRPPDTTHTEARAWRSPCSDSFANTPPIQVNIRPTVHGSFSRCFVTDGFNDISRVVQKTSGAPELVTAVRTRPRCGGAGIRRKAETYTSKIYNSDPICNKLDLQTHGG